MNGAEASSISWVVREAANIGLGSEFYGNVLSLSSIFVAHYATLQGRYLSLSMVAFDGDGSVRLPVGTVRSKRQASGPSSLKGSICVISSINARYSQSLWSGSDAAEAMTEAIAISMGVPVASVSCGFASQLCLTSPTGAPSLAPTAYPTFLAKRVPSARPTPTSTPTVPTFKPTRKIKVTTSRSFEQSVLRVTEVYDDSKPLSFSIYREVPGNV